MNVPKAMEVAEQIQHQGYCLIPNFLSRNRLDSFMPEVYRRFDRLSNNGTIGHVQAGTQKYLQHTLMAHKGILDLYLDPFLIDCAEAYSETTVHLQDYRIYQNLKGCKMHWHVDNKQPSGEGQAELLDHKGLIIIMYLSDSPHGSFQLVRKSHKWAWKEQVEDWETREHEFEKDVVTFEESAGTCIMYDFRGIHRAKPFDQGNPRTAFFAQYSPTASPAGEPLYVDTGMLDNLTDKQKQVLRFGRPASAKTWPVPADHIHEPAMKSFSNKVKRKLKNLLG
jgi:hypothetical protein